MAKRSMLKSGFAAGAAIAALACTQAMAAGRCGASYPVDRPVSLAKVASACNVSLAALKEANPGVNPDYVTPGNHLAVPDEIDDGAYVASPGANLSPDGDYYSDNTPIYQYAEYTEPAPRADATASEAVDGYSPYFIRASATAPVYEDPNLSYQQRSAARIRHAGVTTPAAYRAASGASYISFPSRQPAYGQQPVSPLMECSVLRRQPDGKIKQIREFKPAPEGRETPAHCDRIETISLTRGAPEVVARSSSAAPAPFVPMMVIDGYVSAADADCVTVDTADGERWHVAVDLSPMDLLGKHALIWAEETQSRRCGGLVMASAVYAERIR